MEFIRVSKLGWAAFALIFASASMAAEVPLYRSLRCRGELKNVHQPCGGTNIVELNLRLYADENGIGGGLVLSQAYGGCYPVSSTRFGRWASIGRGENSAKLVAELHGHMSGKVPTFYAHDSLSTVVFGLDLKSNTVTVQSIDPYVPAVPMPETLTCKDVPGS